MALSQEQIDYIQATLSLTGTAYDPARDTLGINTSFSMLELARTVNAMTQSQPIEYDVRSGYTPALGQQIQDKLDEILTTRGIVGTPPGLIWFVENRENIISSFNAAHASGELYFDRSVLDNMIAETEAAINDMIAQEQAALDAAATAETSTEVTPADSTQTPPPPPPPPARQAGLADANLVYALEYVFELARRDEDYDLATQNLVQSHLREHILDFLNYEDMEPGAQKDEAYAFNVQYMGGNKTIEYDGKTYQFDKDGLIHELDAAGKRIENNNPPNIFDPDEPHVATVALLGNILTYQNDLLREKRIDRTRDNREAFDTEINTYLQKIGQQALEDELRGDLRSSGGSLDRFKQSAIYQKLKDADSDTQSFNSFITTIVAMENTRFTNTAEIMSLTEEVSRSDAIWDLFKYMTGDNGYDPQARLSQRNELVYDDAFFSEAAYNIIPRMGYGEYIELGRLYDPGMQAQQDSIHGYFGTNDPAHRVSREELNEYIDARFKLYAIQVLAEKEPPGLSKAEVETFIAENETVLENVTKAMTGRYTNPSTGEVVHFMPFADDVRLAMEAAAPRPEITDPEVQIEIRNLAMSGQLKIDGSYIISRANDEQIASIVSDGIKRISEENLREAADTVSYFANRKHDNVNPARFDTDISKIQEKISQIADGSLDFDKLAHDEKAWILGAIMQDPLDPQMIQNQDFARIVMNAYEPWLSDYMSHRDGEPARDAQGNFIFDAQGYTQWENGYNATYGGLHRDQIMHMYLQYNRFELNDDFGKDIANRFFLEGSARSRMNRDITYEEAIAGMSPEQRKILDDGINSIRAADVIKYQLEMNKSGYAKARANDFIAQQKDRILVTMPAEDNTADNDGETPAEDNTAGNDDASPTAADATPGATTSSDTEAEDSITVPALSTPGPHNLELTTVYNAASEDRVPFVPDEALKGGMLIDVWAANALHTQHGKILNDLKEGLIPAEKQSPARVAARAMEILATEPADSIKAQRAARILPRILERHGLTELDIRASMASSLHEFLPEAQRKEALKAYKHLQTAANAAEGSEAAIEAQRLAKEIMEKNGFSPKMVENIGKVEGGLRISNLMNNSATRLLGSTIDATGRWAYNTATDNLVTRFVGRAGAQTSQYAYSAMTNNRVGRALSDNSLTRGFSSAVETTKDTGQKLATNVGELKTTISSKAAESLNKITSAGRLGKGLRMAFEGAQTLGKGVLKGLGKYFPAIGSVAIGLMAAAETSDLKEHLDRFEKLGLITKDAADDITGVHYTYITQSAADPTVVGGEFGLRGMLDDIAERHNIDPATMAIVSPDLLIDLFDKPDLKVQDIDRLGDTYTGENLERLYTNIANQYGLKTHYTITAEDGRTQTISIGLAMRNEQLAEEIRSAYREARQTQRGTRYSTPENIQEGLDALETINEIAGLAQELRLAAEEDTGYIYNPNRPRTDEEQALASTHTPNPSGPSMS